LGPAAGCFSRVVRWGKPSICPRRAPWPWGKEHRAAASPASRALAVGEGALCRRLTRVACPGRCHRARTSPRPSTGAAAPACCLAQAPPPPRAGVVSCRHARAHGGGRDWGGPHGGERRKMQRGQGGEEKKEEGRGKKK
jgi:hypothetical protein